MTVCDVFWTYFCEEQNFIQSLKHFEQIEFIVYLCNVYILYDVNKMNYLKRSKSHLLYVLIFTYLRHIAVAVFFECNLCNTKGRIVL